MFILALILLIAAPGMANIAQAEVQLGPGDILVTDFNGSSRKSPFGDPFGALFIVDPSTGKRKLLSDFGNPEQGPTGGHTLGVAVDDTGNIFVTDFEAGSPLPLVDGEALAGAVFEVNPSTGKRKLLSDFGNPAQGPVTFNPHAIAIDAAGDLLVLDRAAQLVKVDPVAGFRQIVHDFGNDIFPSPGPVGLVIDASGNVLVTEEDVNPTMPNELGRGALFSINLRTSSQTVMSDFNDDTQGPVGVTLRDVDIDFFTGSILVTDRDAGTDMDNDDPGSGALFSVDPLTGRRELISDFGIQAFPDEPLGMDPIGLAIDALGNILVADRDAGTDLRGALFRVDPSTGERTLITDFGKQSFPNEPLGVDQYGVDVFTPGGAPTLTLVVDPDAGSGVDPGGAGRGALFRVDQTTGERRVVSDFGNPVQGAVGDNPVGVAFDGSGEILVTDLDAGSSEFRGALFTVDPLTGDRRILSDFGVSNDSRLLGRDPFGVALEASGSILVTDPQAGTNFRGALFRIDPSTGDRARIVDFGTRLFRGDRLGIDPLGVAVEPSSQILVIDANAGTGFRGALFRVHPFFRFREIITDFGEGEPGVLGRSPVGVAVDTTERILITDADAGPGLKGALFIVERDGGGRRVLSDFSNDLQGELGDFPVGVAVEDSGKILVADADPEPGDRGLLFQVNRVSGQRTVVSDFSVGEPDVLGRAPQGVVVLPAPDFDNVFRSR